MALVSLKCQNCGQILEIDDTHDIGFCPYCGSKYQLAEKVKVEHSVTVTLNRVADLDGLIKKGFACLNTEDEAYARALFNKALSLDRDNIYANIGMLIANGSKKINTIMTMTEINTIMIKFISTVQKYPKRKNRLSPISLHSKP